MILVARGEILFQNLLYVGAGRTDQNILLTEMIQASLKIEQIVIVLGKHTKSGLNIFFSIFVACKFVF